MQTDLYRTITVVEGWTVCLFLMENNLYLQSFNTLTHEKETHFRTTMQNSPSYTSLGMKIKTGYRFCFGPFMQKRKLYILNTYDKKFIVLYFRSDKS